MRSLFLILSAFIATGATAQDWAELDGDTRMTGQALADLTNGHVLTFYDDGQSSYGADGSYSYTYAGGDSATGRFSITDDGLVCVAFDNGRSRCDRFVQSRGRVVLLTAKGDRFPVRP